VSAPLPASLEPAPHPNLLGTHAPTAAALRCAAVAVVAAALALTVVGTLPAVGLAGVGVVVAVSLLVRRRHAVLDEVLGVCGALASAVALPQAAAGGGAPAVAPVLALALAVRQFAVVRSSRHLRAALGMCVLVTVAAAGTAPSNALVGPIALVWVAVLAGLACSVPHRPVDGSLLRRAGAAGAVATTVALVLFLLLPTPQSPRGGAGGDSSEQEAAPRSAEAYAGGSMDLWSRGELPRTELLRVPADSPQLWRAAVLDVYDGRSWSSSGNPVTWTSVAGAGYTAVPEVGASDTQRVDEVVPLDSYAAVVSAGSPVAVRTSARAYDAGSGLVLQDAPTPYEVTSRVVPSVEEQVLPVAGAAGLTDPARWTQLPRSVPQRVVDLGRRLGGGGDPVAAARAVSEHLRSTSRYSLDARLPARGQDAVDAFLFDSHVGFCEHFASAEVVLLRAAGYPARVVTGFAGGDPASSGGASPGGRVVRASNAHAWVEVWVPGTGWVELDPTAGVPLLDGAGGSGGWWHRLWSQVQRTVDRVLADARARTLLAVGLSVLLVVAVLLVRRARRGRSAGPDRVGAPAARRADPAVAAVLLALTRFEEAVPPPWGRGVSEGLSDWRERLATSPVGSPEVAAALVVVERACFARVVPGRAELDGALRALESATSILLAARARVGARG
jgi:transglutaminase-like putative cysteine protease